MLNDAPASFASAWPMATGQTVLYALSADATLLSALRATRAGAPCWRVHSVFTHTINVDRGAGEWLTLSSRDADNAPASIVVELDDWQESGLVAGASVACAASALVFASGLRVELECARSWRCELPPYAAETATLVANVEVASAHLRRFGRGIGIARALPWTTVFDRALAAGFAEHTGGLCHALAAGDFVSSEAHVRALVGLGPGLTPAGDDFLVGLLAVLNLPGGPLPAGGRLGDAVLACAATQTNAISRAALRYAARGEVRASLARLCSALMHLKPTPMLAALDAVLAIGASSGTDMALGMLSAFKLLLQSKG